MKGPHRLDRLVCGAVLSNRGRNPAALQVLSAPQSRLGLPRRCNNSHRHVSSPRDQPRASWLPSGATTDPASGTLLPFLFPAAWTALPGQKRAGGRHEGLRTAPLHTNARRSAESGWCTAKVRKSARFTIRASHSNAAETSTPNDDIAPGAPPSPREPPLALPAPKGDAFFSASMPPDTDMSKSERGRQHHQDQDELLSYVGPPPDGDSVDEHLQYINDPYRHNYAQPDGPDLHIGHTREDTQYPTWDDVARAGLDAQERVRALQQAVRERLHNPARTSADEVYARYRQLPDVRMTLIPEHLRHQLLKSLGMVERKDVNGMLRYFALVADVRDSGFPLWKAEWNAAISFASRYVGTTTAKEAESAVSLWRQMEQEKYMRGNAVTFNILFDVASKAGNFVLAEMVFAEMEKRGLRFSRYHHVSLMHFFGLKADADGIRVAYKEMVQSGQMIDTVVLNCAIAGFLRCGEEDAALRVYAHMRRNAIGQLTKGSGAGTEHASTDASASDADGTLPANANKDKQEEVGCKDDGNIDRDSFPNPALDVSGVASQKAMTHVLMMLAKVSRGDAVLQERFQNLVPTRPNLGTYRILVNRYAVQLGNLGTVTRLLSDMATLQIPLHGAIFLALFKGFALHGGRTGTGSDWSEQRLRSIWTALLKALDDAVTGLHVTAWLVIWVMRAFDRCTHDPEQVFKAYNSLASRWTPSVSEADFAIDMLHKLLRKRQQRPFQDKGIGRPPPPTELRFLG